MPYLRFLLEGGFCQRINQLLEFSRPFPSLPCFTSALSSCERPLVLRAPSSSFPPPSVIPAFTGIHLLLATSFRLHRNDCRLAELQYHFIQQPAQGLGESLAPSVIHPNVCQKLPVERQRLRHMRHPAALSPAARAPCAPYPARSRCQRAIGIADSAPSTRLPDRPCYTRW